MATTPIGGSPDTRYYSLNPPGDTEVTTRPDGTVAATYRYTAYGQIDQEGTTGEDAPTADGTNPEDPVNPLQYQAQWLDGAPPELFEDLLLLILQPPLRFSALRGTRLMLFPALLSVHEDVAAFRRCSKFM